MMNMEMKYYRHNRYGMAGVLVPYTIRYHDLTFLLDGTLTYRVDGKAVTLRAGDAIFIREGACRERDPGAAKADYVSFNFVCDEVPEELPLLIRGGVSREIGHLLAACDEINEHTQSENNRRRGFVLACILQLLRESAAVSYSSLTARILQYLHAHLSERVTLAEIGAAMHFSPVYCDTVFRRETGSSIISYLLDERMEAAKRMLCDGEALATVANAVGFTDYNYFARYFKKRVGYTPVQYRRFLQGQ